MFGELSGEDEFSSKERHPMDAIAIATHRQQADSRPIE